MKKLEKLKSLIKKVEKNKPEELYAKVQGIPSPEKINYKGSNQSFVPDLVAKYEDSEDIYVIEEKYTKSSLSEMLSRWLLFSTEARKRRGKFYLFVPEKHLSDIQDILERKQIVLELNKV